MTNNSLIIHLEFTNHNLLYRCGLSTAISRLLVDCVTLNIYNCFHT